MNNFLKKLSFLPMVVCIILLLLPLSDVYAAPKMNKTSVSVNIGKTTQLKVKGSSKTFKWSSANKKIATVDSKGKVTGVSAGSTYIYAKSGNTKLKCLVKVKFNQKDAKKNISIKYASCDKYTIAFVTNKNKYPVSISADMVFYNKNKKILDASSDDNYCLGSKKTCVLTFLHPYDDNKSQYIKPAKYKMTYNLSSSFYTDYSSKISCKSSLGINSAIVQVKNKGSKDLDTVHLTCVFYNKKGKVIGVESHYADCNDAKSSDVVSFSYPYDSDYEKIIPASCKIYVNHAYQYWD